jgi:hypothetical protein
MADKGQKRGSGHTDVAADLAHVEDARASLTRMAADLSKTGEVGQTAGRQIRGGGLSGAAGLMVLSQAIDDVNYGFMAIVKTVPQMGTSIGSVLGMSTNAAMKLGAVAGIAAVALELLVTQIGEGVALLGHLGQGAEKAQAPIGTLATTINERNAKPVELAIDTGVGTEAAQQRDRAEHIQILRDKEADRLARAMQEGLGRDLLKDGGIPDADLERNVRNRLKSSGMDEQKIAETAAVVAKRLRENIEEEVRARSLSRNISEGHARQEWLAEADEKAKTRNEKDVKASEVLSGKAFLDRMLVAGFSKPKDDRIAEAQLREQEKTNAKLEEIKEWTKKPKKGAYATFARGRP